MSLDNEMAGNQKEFLHHCYRDRSVTINPIIDWSVSDVWQFLHHYGCEGNPLYQCGRYRIGCVGCPIASNRQQQADFIQYPKFRANYVKTFDRMLKAREEAGMDNRCNWKTGEDVMRWWISDDTDPNQLSFFDDNEIVDIMREME